MIQLAGRPFLETDFIPSDSMENVILQRLQEDARVYSYKSLRDLEFELLYRRNIILSAKAMSEGEARFEIFSGSRSNPRFWQLTDTGGFLLKENVKPADAISDIFTNSSEYSFECATAKVIILYYALLLTIGDELFNKFFENLYLYSWHFDSDLVMDSIHSEHFIPGDVVYFNNPDYHPQTFWWRGENAVVLDDGTYFGHGLGIRNGDEIIEFLNETRKPDSTKPAYLTDYVARPSFSHLAELFQNIRGYNRIKQQHLIVNHNKSSISCGRYLSYLYSFYSEFP